MAKRASSKWFSRLAENRCARAYNADVDPSSGAGVKTKGDSKQRVGTRRAGLRDQLFESKHRGTYEKSARSGTVNLAVLEKLADAAWAENREPVLHLSILDPHSPLSNEEGCVDVVVRLMEDDVRRERWLMNPLEKNGS